MPKKSEFLPTNRLREEREKRNLSLAVVAEVANTTYAQIARLEKGERELTQAWLNRISPALEVLPADLLLRSEGALKPLERELVTAFRQSNAQGKEAIISVVRSQSRWSGSDDI